MIISLTFFLSQFLSIFSLDLIPLGRAQLGGLLLLKGSFPSLGAHTPLFSLYHSFHYCAIYLSASNMNDLPKVYGKIHMTKNEFANFFCKLSETPSYFFNIISVL